jgi:hypothetical protein
VILSDFFLTGSSVGGTLGDFDGTVIDAKMLVVADAFQVVGEFGGEGVAVRPELALAGSAVLQGKRDRLKAASTRESCSR